MILIFLLVCIGFLVVIKKTSYERDSFVKKIIFISLLAIPFLSSFFPKFTLFGKYIRLPLAFSFIYFTIAGVYLFLYNFKIKIPKYAIWFSIYVAFTLANNFIQNGYRDDNWITYNLYEYVFPLGFIILIENLEYDDKDIHRLINILSIVVIGAFIVSSIQFTINPFFYASVNLDDMDAAYRLQFMYGAKYRCYSIFSGLKGADVGFAILCLFNIFLFLMLRIDRKKYIDAIAILIFIIGILSFARWVWISLIVSILFFSYYKYGKKSFIYLIVVSLFMVIPVIMYWSNIMGSEIFTERIASTTYESRVFTPQIYMNEFFLRNPFFGYGEGSGFNAEFLAVYHVIHVLWFEIMFQNGIIGLMIYLIFVYSIYQRAQIIYKYTGNPVIFAWIISLLIANSTAPFDLINYYGNFVMFLYIAMNYKLYVENAQTMEDPINKNFARI